MEKLSKRIKHNIDSSDSEEAYMNKIYSKKTDMIRRDIKALWEQKPSITNCSVVWDIENCQVKRGRSVADICESLDDLSIRYSIDIKSIYAIGNSFMFRHGLQDELMSKGIIFDDTDCKKANISDVKIASKINEITLKNPPPYTIVLISGDSDFGCTLDLLNTHGYSTILIYSDLAKNTFIQKASKSISWSSLLETPKYEHGSPVNKLGMIKSGEKSVRFNFDTSHNSLVGKRTCMVYKFGSNMYGQYTIPDDFDLYIGDFVIINDTKSHYAKWNIGKVQKFIQCTGNIEFDPVIDIIMNRDILVPKLKKILDTNMKFLQVAKQCAKTLLPKTISIVHTEMRCDGNNVTIYYLSFDKHSTFEITPFISKIRDICKMYVYMERRIACAWEANCKKPFCNYYHNQ